MTLEELVVGTKLKFKHSENLSELLHCVEIADGKYSLRVNGSGYCIENDDLTGLQKMVDVCEIMTEEEYETRIREFWKGHEHPEGQEEFLDEAESSDTTS